ncbi:hypothetical protein GCM10029978_014080 [Actinoallomurus acanthiterrae]
MIEGRTNTTMPPATAAALLRVMVPMASTATAVTAARAAVPAMMRSTVRVLAGKT